MPQHQPPEEDPRHLGPKFVVERVQTGVRIEKRLLKVLKALAEYLDITLGDLLEGIVLHAFDGKATFQAETLRQIQKIKEVYGLELDAGASHRLIEGQPRSPFTARRIRESGTLRVALPPAEAFEFFTPLGEKDWIAGWDPDFLVPASGELEEGQVFVTEHGGETTIWDVLRLDRHAHQVEYLRCTPGSRTGRVAVRCAPSGEADAAEGSEVEVTYTLTALAADANPVLDEFAAGFANMVRTWETLIADRLG